MMTNSNNWPDPAKPGYPLNPEKNGPHAIINPQGEVIFALWDSSEKSWLKIGFSFDSIWGAGMQYLGPCIPLGEQYAAGYAQGATDARKADVERLRRVSVTIDNHDEYDDYNMGQCSAYKNAADTIEAAPLPHSKPDQESNPSISSENTQPDSGWKS